MKHLSIRLQLAIIVGLSFLPIALLAYLFVNQSNKEIGFAQKENDGVAYIEALLPDFAALAGGGVLEPANAALETAHTRFDAEMASAALADDYMNLRGQNPAAAREAVSKLLSKVGDTSNLILDPDLDSYYVMDILVLKLPAALNSAADLVTAFQTGMGQAQNAQDIQVDLLSRLRIFGDLIEGTSVSLASAMDGNADGGVKAALVPAFAEYRKAADAYADSVESALAAFAADPATSGMGNVKIDEARFAEAALVFGQAVGTEMSRLLQMRVAGFDSRLWTLLAISSGLILLVLGYSALAAKGIVSALNRLEGNIRRLAEGVGDDDVGSFEGKDEISAISRAVAHLRERTVMRQKEVNDAKLAEQAENDRERVRVEAVRVAEAEEKATLADEQARVVAKLKDALMRLAEGDLGAAIDTAFPDKLDEIRLAFNQTVDSFADVVSRIRETSRGLKTATGEILAGANDLSERTTKQAATIEETSAAMEQLAQTVNDHAGKAESALSKTVAASKLAKEGGEVMGEANAAMERITSSSSKISNIIGMIDDIAFQTNLLALNASVEAARAGEAGKGFAVVAIEVRRLAQSAAQASSEVKILIEQSAQEVAGGTKLVAGAAQSLSSLLNTVVEFSELMREIAKDSREQASAIDEVNIAVRQMDEMTQHNAALVEQTNAAIEQTEGQASELDRVVEVFTLAGNNAGKPVARPSPNAVGRVKSNLALDRDWSAF